MSQQLCPQSRDFIENSNASITQEQLDTLRNHAAECANCREHLLLHLDLFELGRDLPFPKDEEFLEMRRTVRRRTRLQPAAVARIGSAHWAAFAKVGLAAGLAIGCFFLGRASIASTGLETLVATGHSQLSIRDLREAPYVLSNVQFRKLPGERLGVSFDLTQHFERVEPYASPLVGEVLAWSLARESSLGSKLRAASLAPQSESPVVQDALALALRHDPHPAVRLEALSAIAQLPRTEAIESVLLETLRLDESVQVRLKAVDLLANGGLPLQRLRETLDQSTQPTDTAVRLHLATYERPVASKEKF